MSRRSRRQEIQRRRERSESVNNYTGREVSNFAKRSLPRDYFKTSLRDVEDRRRFHPMGSIAPARRFYPAKRKEFRVAGVPVARAQRAAGYRAAHKLEGYEPLPWRIGFADPAGVVVCVRRRIRRAVLHAFGIAGRRGLGRGGVRRNEFSSIGC